MKKNVCPHTEHCFKDQAKKSSVANISMNNNYLSTHTALNMGNDFVCIAFVVNVVIIFLLHMATLDDSKKSYQLTQQ